MSDIGGALVTALVVLIGLWLKPMIDSAFARRKKSEEAKHAASRLVVELDRYIHQAAAVASDSGRDWGYDPDGRHIVEPQEDQPSLSDPLSAADWKLIDSEILYAFFSLEDHERDVHAQMKFAAEELVTGDDGEEWFDARMSGYKSLTEHSLRLREKLEERYAVPERANRGWDPVAHMRSKHRNKEAK